MAFEDSILGMLRTRQKMFAEYYLSNGFNATQAALSAGYSKKTAYAIGIENLKKLEIKEYISQRVKALLSETEMASLKIINALDEIIECDIGDFVRIETIEKPETLTQDGEVIPGEVYQKVIFNDTEKLNTRVISEISEGQHGIKIKTQDKLRAIELKGKYLSLWADGLSVNQPEAEKEKTDKEARRNRILELQRKLK